MRTIHRIGVGFLVGLFFAGGYAARVTSARQEIATLGASERGAVSAPGTPIASARLEGGANIDLRPLETMLMVLKNLREHYVEQLTATDEGKMTHDSVSAMLASLGDPNTRFMQPEQRKLVSDAREGKYHGVGAILGIRRIKTGSFTEEHLVVIAPMEGGAAAKAGLKPGDDIIAVDGKSVLPFNPYQKATALLEDYSKRKIDQSQARKMVKEEEKRIEGGIGILEADGLLTSDSEKPVELTIARDGSAKDLKVKLDREEFAVTPVESSVKENDTVGYVRINCFAKNTAGEFQNAIAGMESKHVKGLVLDLRSVAGGEPEQAVAIAKPFMAGKTLAVELKSRSRKSKVQIPSTPTETRWNLPVVVLVNGGTARMPEVIAAALRENLGSRLVGEKTYGDFSSTTLIDERDGSALVMTTGAFLTPKGANYNGKGLKVDVEVASAASGDPQLREAVRLAAHGGKG